MAKKIALGKGFASLIQDTPNEILKASLKDLEKKEAPKVSEVNIGNTGETYLVDIKQIKTNPNQPRKIFKEKELEELSLSIKENGVIQPLIVLKADKGFELIAGERRLRASKLAGLTKVPVVIKKVTEREKVVMSIIENVQRSDLNCVEEALAYYQLMSEYELTQEEVGKKIGKERSSIANYLRVLKLPRAVIELLQKELLSFGHAKVMAAEKDREKVIRLANLAATESWSIKELQKELKKKIGTTNEPVKKDDGSESLNHLKNKLEQNTGFHFGIKNKKSGSGEIIIKYNNEAEFNDIYDYLLK
jgi:ParB family chromosome partitioning protein